MGDDGSDLHYEGKLGRWLQDQRRMKKGTRGSKRLTAEREEKLQELVDQGMHGLIYLFVFFVQILFNFR